MTKLHILQNLIEFLPNKSLEIFSLQKYIFESYKHSNNKHSITFNGKIYEIKEFVIDRDTLKISDIISKYLEFNNEELFLCGDLIKIFGGAIRDAINGDEIQDVDILCTPDARNSLYNLMENNGYVRIDDFCKNSFNSMYKDIHIINEPITFINSNFKKIQLIFPTPFKSYMESHNRLISNVDISCCGLSYNGTYIYEHCEDALLHAQYKWLFVNENSHMYNKNRINTRIMKFLNRGYKNNEKLDIYRNQVLDDIIINNPTYLQPIIKKRIINNEKNSISFFL